MKPGSSRSKVGGRFGDDQLVVAVTARPVDGAANDAVTRAVADALGLRPRQVSLVSGHTARSKVLEVDVDDTEVATVAALVVGLLGS